MFKDPRPFSEEPPPPPILPKPHRKLSRKQWIITGVLSMLLLSSAIAGVWTAVVIHSHADAASGGLTFQQFLAQTRPDGIYHGALKMPSKVPPVPTSSKEHGTDYTKLFPSNEPATMKPLMQALDGTMQTASLGGKGLNLLGSDGRFQVQFAPGALDVHAAKTVSNLAISSGLRLHVQQLSGHIRGQVSALGVYQVQVTDNNDQAVTGVGLHTPITFVYHYQPGELEALGLDPNSLKITWPQHLAQARQDGQSQAPYIVALKNDPVAQTLTAQTTTLVAEPLTVSGTSVNQQVPLPHFASMQGNAGQLSYSYPLKVVPGAAGLAPQLALTYSSESTNNRYSRTAPANSVGEGWSLSLGAITSETYASGSLVAGPWYFLSGVGGVSDRLVPNPHPADSTNVDFLTEHISQLRVRQSNPTSQNTCFTVYDTSGTMYEFGCTTDSVRFTTSGTTRQNYEWDLDRIVAPSQGASTAYKIIKISYLQDCNASPCTNVRDAGIKQITYGYSTSGNTSIDNLVGTVDFSYATIPYSTTTCSDGSSTPNGGLRCDDPYGDQYVLDAPLVMSTLTLQSVTSYVGSDTSGSKAYGYNFSYQDSGVSEDVEPISGLTEVIAGEHLLTKVTPSVYQSNTAHALMPALFQYNARTTTGTDLTTDPMENTYYDSALAAAVQTNVQYSQYTSWQYMTKYWDSSSGIGASINYARAYSNTHGTPENHGDTRYDPLYCTLYASECTGGYAHPDDRAWTVQVVTNITSLGSDAVGLPAATTSYAYRLAKTGQSTTTCTTAGTDSDCVGYNWTPVNSTTLAKDTDWQDYYHSEYRGFNGVFTTSTNNDLTAEWYYSTEGWNTASSDAKNYNAGHAYEQDIYQGNTFGAPIHIFLYQYTGDHQNTPGNSDYTNSCNGNYSSIYSPCEVMVLWDRSNLAEGQDGSGPLLEHDYIYDDYTSSGLTSGYHNLTQEVTQPSNNLNVTQKWYYKPHDTTVSGIVYYDVNKPFESEVDDPATGHRYACTYTLYDESPAGAGGITPNAGWPTTIKTYGNSTCGSDPSQGAPASSVTPLTTSYLGYDAYGNAVASVDAVGAANSSLYSSNGCSLTTAPVWMTSTANWASTQKFTACTTYDSFNAQPATTKNALNLSTSISYDSTQGRLPTQVTDANGQNTTTSYSYDSGSATNEKVITAISQPQETATYTQESYPFSSCATSIPSSVVAPCLHVSSKSSLYSNAISQAFYDSLGRQVETNTPIATPVGGNTSNSYYTVQYTEYQDDAAHSTWTSNPFVVTGPAAGLNWVDPSNATDYLGNAPRGTATYYDTLGRVIAVQDPAFDPAHSVPGISCPPLGSNATSCVLRTVGYYGSPFHYADQVTTIDANNHEVMSKVDSLGRTALTDWYSGVQGGSTSINEEKTYQYNVLGELTSTSVTDEAPQSGQGTTSVTTTEQYDDLGRLTTLTDPDRGTHTLTYDPDGRVIKDVSGTRTIGTNYDLLGRVGCVQDATITINATGACSAGNPLVQNSYDTSNLTLSGTTDYPKGELTKSIANTRYSDGTVASTTTSIEYDVRGRPIASQLQIATPSSWGVTTTLPTYQLTDAYNDANQVTTTQTSANGVVGYATTQQYETPSGFLKGLANTSGSTLATLNYQAQGLLDSISFQSNTNTVLANDQFTYDNDLRTLSSTATWQSGSGSSGTIVSQTRGYDPASNVTSLSTTQVAVPGQTSSGGNDVQNFCYDEQNRLVWAGNSGTQPGAGSGTCGNATLTNGITGGTESDAYAYTHLGQLWLGHANGSATTSQYLYCDSTHPHQLTGLYATSATCSSKTGQVYASSYDSWGNVTQRSYSGVTATLSYDTLDHFTQWNGGSTNQEWYVYDAAGNRVLKRTTGTGGTVLTSYPFGLEEHQFTSAGAANGGDKYYYSLGGSLIGELNGTTTQYFILDGLGSPLGSISNVAGSAAVQGNQLFDPYGERRYHSGTVGTSKQFTGQYNDAQTGLNYYNARYYDSIAGVFLSADVVQGNVGGMNPYGYVGGNPETASDPSGQRIVDSGGGGVPEDWFSSVTFTPPASGSSSGGGAVGGSAQSSSNSGGCAFNPNVASDCFGIQANTQHSVVTITQIKIHTDPSGGPVVCLGFCIQASTTPAIHNIINVPVQTSVTAPTDLCLNVFACASGSGGDGAKGEDESTSSDACSFTPATSVETDHGEKPIGSLKKDDRVWAYNPKTQKMEFQPIEHVWINHDDDLIDLTLTVPAHEVHGKLVAQTSEVVHTNKKHPFLTQEEGFVSVGDLMPGMHIVRADGSVGVVSQWVVVPGIETMYNLEVAQDHTFAVGDGQWVVHNCTVGDGPRTLQQLVGDNTKGRQSIRLFRAVDAGELEAIKASGGFDMSGSTGNIHKYFTLSQEEAIAFGKTALSNFGIVSAEFPRSLLVQGEWPDNVIMGVIHNETIREIALPGSLLSYFQDLKFHGFYGGGAN